MQSIATAKQTLAARRSPLAKRENFQKNSPPARCEKRSSDSVHPAPVSIVVEKSWIRHWMEPYKPCNGSAPSTFKPDFRRGVACVITDGRLLLFGMSHDRYNQLPSCKNSQKYGAVTSVIYCCVCSSNCAQRVKNIIELSAFLYISYSQFALLLLFGNGMQHAVKQDTELQLIATELNEIHCVT